MAKAKSKPPKRAPSDAPPTQPPSVVVKSDLEGSAPNDAPLLFCPFCRECYEGIAQCPDHDLTLVSWEALPRSEEPEEMGSDDAVSPVDLRYGRGELLAGVAVLMMSVLSPLFRVTEGEDGRSFSLLEAATDRAPNLWTVPFVAALVLSIVLRRRTIGQMLGARLAMLILATGPFISLGYTLWKIYDGAAQMSEVMHREVHVQLSWGVGLVLAGGALLVVGSLRLGTIPHPVRKGRRADIEDELR
jgi:hypothetical protein